MTNDVNKIFESIANAASEVVDEAKDVAQSASKVIAGQYGNVKLRLELSQLQEVQRGIFAQIGRTLFLIHSGEFKNEDGAEEGDNIASAQKIIDENLLEAAKLDAQISALQIRIAQSQNKRICQSCKNACAQNEAYCSSCGNKL